MLYAQEARRVCRRNARPLAVTAWLRDTARSAYTPHCLICHVKVFARIAGTAGLVLLVSLVVLLAARRRDRTAGSKAGPPGSTLHNLAGGGGAAAGASAEVVLDVPSILPSDDR